VSGNNVCQLHLLAGHSSREFRNLKLYHVTFTNKLSDVDVNWHCNSCHPLLNTLLNTLSKLKVLCTDECTIYGSTRCKNVMFWVKVNPHFLLEWNITLYMLRGPAGQQHILFALVSLMDLLMLHFM
jgi:hypothetical protein